MAEARQPGAMPLRLRRAAVQYPRAHWEPSNEHLVILSGETVVGSLMRQTGGTGRRPLVLVDYLRAHRPRREPTQQDTEPPHHRYVPDVALVLKPLGEAIVAGSNACPAAGPANPFQPLGRLVWRSCTACWARPIRSKASREG